MSLVLEMNAKSVTETVLHIKGILDISTVETFNNQLGSLSELHHLIIDYSEMEFIDSTGIGCIMEIIYLSQDKGYSLTFEGLSETITEIFETVGLFQIMSSLNVGVK